MNKKDSTTKRNLLIAGLVTIVLGIIQVLVFPPLIIGVGFVRSLIPFIVSCIFLILGWKDVASPYTWCFSLRVIVGVVFNYPYGGALGSRDFNQCFPERNNFWKHCPHHLSQTLNFSTNFCSSEPV